MLQIKNFILKKKTQYHSSGSCTSLPLYFLSLLVFLGQRWGRDAKAKFRKVTFFLHEKKYKSVGHLCCNFNLL